MCAWFFHDGLSCLDVSALSVCLVCFSPGLLGWLGGDNATPTVFLFVVVRRGSFRMSGRPLIRKIVPGLGAHTRMGFDARDGAVSGVALQAGACGLPFWTVWSRRTADQQRELRVLRLEGSATLGKKKRN